MMRPGRWGLAMMAMMSVTACNQDAGSARGGGAQAVAQGPGDMVDCAIGSSGQWRPACRAEQDGDRLVLRHPDGGFRRLRIVSDGHGLVSADGAERAKLTIIAPQQVEVLIGADRYRLPVTVAAAVR